MRAQSAKTPGSASVVPATSTGLRRVALGDSTAASRSRVARPSVGMPSPWSVSTSAAMVAWPPPSARIATAGLAIGGRLDSASATGNSSSEWSTVTMPARPKAVRETSEIPARAPVCEPADRLPVAERPPLSSTIGLTRVVR